MDPTIFSPQFFFLSYFHSISKQLKAFFTPIFTPPPLIFTHSKVQTHPEFKIKAFKITILKCSNIEVLQYGFLEKRAQRMTQAACHLERPGRRGHFFSSGEKGKITQGKRLASGRACSRFCL